MLNHEKHEKTNQFINIILSNAYYPLTTHPYIKVFVDKTEVVKVRNAKFLGVVIHVRISPKHHIQALQCNISKRNYIPYGIYILYTCIAIIAVLFCGV